MHKTPSSQFLQVASDRLGHDGDRRRAATSNRCNASGPVPQPRLRQVNIYRRRLFGLSPKAELAVLAEAPAFRVSIGRRPLCCDRGRTPP